MEDQDNEDGASTSDIDVTSDYESVNTSEFISVATSRLVHRYQHGRRYQGFLAGRYGLPNDDAEQVREGIKHKLYTDYLLKGDLIIAPVGQHPQKIVDLGTGFGFWALDVAERYPSARVIGTDLSPIQPAWIPPNIEFRVEDLEDEHRPWTSIYADSDLINVRALLQTLRHPRRLLENAFDNLKPGGWIQVHEIIPYVFSDDGTADDTHPMNTFYHLMEGPFTTSYGWNLRFPALIPETLASTGFINVNTAFHAVPVGRWSSDSATMREMGLFCQSICEEWVITMLTNHDAMGLGYDEAKKLVQDVLTAMDSPRIHGKLKFIDCWAQKPST